MAKPQPVRVFHITAMANLSEIFARRMLLSKNCVASKGISYANIAHQGAQGARSVKTVPNPPGGTIHDYVPFYFAPRSPMLSAIHTGRVPGYLGGQASIVHLETTIPRALSSGQPYVFFDRNATISYSQPFTNLVDL